MCSQTAIKSDLLVGFATSFEGFSERCKLSANHLALSLSLRTYGPFVRCMTQHIVTAPHFDKPMIETQILLNIKIFRSTIRLITS